MGGGGGGGFIPRSSESIQRRIDQAREAEQQRLDSQVNNLLCEFLATVNDRDSELTQRRIQEVREVLGETADVEALLFGGSVAKHTYVDGLSDVDALVILKQEGTQGVSSQKLLDDFHRQLDVGLSRADVAGIDKGAIAVTVRFRDGSELQLLPAVRTRQGVAIPDRSGRGWKDTNPKAFQRELTRQNDRLNRTLVPTIKLVKSLVGDLPEQQQISGYHAEALCLDAARGYAGPTTPKAVLSHVLEHASGRVLKPIRDVSGQSRVIDSDLGEANSTQRRIVSQALAGIRRRLEAATSLRQWRAMFGRGEE